MSQQQIEMYDEQGRFVDNQVNIRPEQAEGNQFVEDYQNIGPSKVVPMHDGIETPKQVEASPLMEKDDYDPIIPIQTKWNAKINVWMDQFKTGKMKVSNEQASYEQNIDMIYRGLICLRRVTRIFLHIITLGAVIGFFLWGYYVSVGDSTWTADSSHSIIFVNQSNCVVNIVDSSSSLVSFSYFVEGGLQKQINSSSHFKISGVETADSLNLTFRSPNHQLTSCLITLEIPPTLTNFTLYCEVEGFCVTVFNTTKFQTSALNIIADNKAQLQVNIQNATSSYFHYYSAAAGALYLNNVFFTKGYIEQEAGTILVQSLGDINVTFSSFQKSYCAASINTVASVANCGLNDTKLCAGTLSACGSASCNYQSNIQIRGNSSNIYVNQLKSYGKSWINGEDQFSMIQSALYDFYADPSTPLFTNIDSSTKKEINQILNTTLAGSSFSFRIDIGGHYLLRQQDNSYWAYFSNRRFSEFQPWWISTLSGSLLQSKFSYIQGTLLPGFCPYQPTMNLTQLYSVQQVLQNTMNQDFDSVVYIQKDNRQLPAEKPDANFTYTGVDDLPEKKKNQYEQWFIFEITNDSYIYESLPYSPFFIASIILSIISALIFAATATYFLRTGMYGLEEYMLQSVATFQNYSSTNIPEKDDVKQAIAKSMIAKLDQLESQKSPPLLYGILSYGLYIYGQEAKASAQSFCNTFFRKTNEKETDQFYNGSLDQEMIAIDEADLKELYETFCYLNRLTIEQLSQDEKLLESFGYEIVEKDSTSAFLSKLKMKTDRKPYHLLNEKEKNSNNSLELFISTQIQLTGIEADIIAADKLEKYYKEFCGRVLNVESFNVRDIANDYSLGISDKKNFELRLQPSLRQKEKSWISRFLGRCVNYVPIVENYYEKDPVYVIRRNNQVLNFQQNPFKTLKSRKWSWLYYNFVTMWYSSLKFNYKRRIFNREFTYGEEGDNNIIMDFLDAIYMKGWVWTEVMVVLGNLLFTAIAVLPIAFFLMLVNTQYSVYSIYDPRNLIFIEDILQRPWTVFNSSYVVDQWVLAGALLLLIYVGLAFIFQLLYFFFASFPEEIGLLLDYQVYNKKGITYYLNWLQWIMFLVLYFFVFTYFGVILVWLLLGAIINPQDYLTYSTSALTLMATIFSQYQSIQYIYEQSTLQIKKITSELYLKTFGAVAFSLIKEVQRLSDNSLALINSTAMDTAREMADQLGFGEELDELNILTQSMTENVSSGANLDVDQLKFKQIKDKFIEKSCEKFVTIATNQFQVPELIAQLLVKSNFLKFEEIVDTLANQIQLESKNTVPAGLIKWLFKSYTQLSKALQKQSNDEKKKELAKLMPKLCQGIIDAAVDSMLMKNPINDRGATQDTIKASLNFTLNIMQDHEPENILHQITEFIGDIEQTVNIDPQPLQILQMLFKYASIVLKQPQNIEVIQQQLIQDILKIFNIDPDLSFMLQLIFTGGRQTQYKVAERTIETPNDLSNQVLQFQKKYLALGDNDQSQDKFEIMITAALKFLRNDKLPYREILQFIIANKEDEPISQFLTEAYDQYQHWIHIGASIIQLASKDWNEQLKLTEKGINSEILEDIVFMGSKQLWSSKILDKQEQKPQESTDKEWDQQIWQQGATAKPKRQDKLIGRDLIELSAQALQIKEESVIGLILILRGESGNSIYHKAFYQDLLKIVVNNQQQIDLSLLKNLFELFLTKDLSQVPQLISNLENNPYGEIKKQLINLALSDNSYYFIFGEENITAPLKEDIKKQLNQQYEIKSLDNKDQIEEKERKTKLINYYASEKATFYQFLKKNINEEAGVRELKQKILSAISIASQIKIDYFYMLLELSSQLQVPSNAIANFNLLEGFKIEAFRNLLYILQFKDVQMICRGVQYFVNQNPQEYNGLDLTLVANYAQTYVDAESLLASIIIPNDVPFFIQNLYPLLINNIFKNRVGLDGSYYKQLIRLTSSKVYPVPEIFKEAQIKKNLTQVALFVDLLFSRIPENEQQKLERKKLIDSVIKFLVPISGRNNERKDDALRDFILACIDKDFDVLTKYLVDYCKNFGKKRHREFFKKAAYLLQGFGTNQVSKEKIVSASQYLKYFLTYDSTAFLELIQSYQTNVLGLKPDLSPIKSLWTIFTNKPEFQQISQYFQIDEKIVRIADFFVQAMTSENKQQTLIKLQGNQEMMKYIESKTQAKDVSILIELSGILEQTLSDTQKYISWLKLNGSLVQQKLFEAFFAFRQQLKGQATFELNLKQFRQQAALRKTIIQREELDVANKKQQNNDQKLLFSDGAELISWFGHTKPMNLIYKLHQVQIIKPKEPLALLFGAVGAIAKYDLKSQYSQKEPQFLKNQQEKIQKLQSKSIERVFQYLDEQSDDLSEAFQFLFIATGIDPILAAGIIHNEPDNQFLDYYLRSLVEEDKLKVRKIFEQLDDYSLIPGGLRMRIVENEFLQLAINNQETNLDKYVIKDENELIKDLPILKKLIKDGQHMTDFPLSSVILCFALKHLRENSKQFTPTEPKSKNKQFHPIARFYRGAFLIDQVLTIYEKYAFFHDQNSFCGFNKPLIVQILTYGLYYNPQVNGTPQFQKVQQIQYPSLADNQQNYGSNLNYYLKAGSIQEISKYIVSKENIDPHVSIFSSVQESDRQKNYSTLSQQLLIQDNNKSLDIQDKVKINGDIKSHFTSSTDSLVKKFADLQSTIDLQRQFLQFVVESDPQRFRFMNTKYVGKALIYLKQQLLKPAEIESLSNDAGESQDKLAISLIKFYLGQASFEKKDEIQKQNAKQVKDDSEDILKKFVDPIKSKYVKFQGQKNLQLVNTGDLINQIFQIYLNDEQQRQVNFLVNILYNPRYITLQDFKVYFAQYEHIFGVIFMMLRIKLEQSKQEGKFGQLGSRLPESLLYSTMGDKFYNMNPETKQKLMGNNQIFNQSVESLIQNCNSIPNKCVEPLKLLIRCYMGDVEAWYALFMITRNLDIKMEDKLSERLLQTMILKLLLQLKNLGLRSSTITRTYLSTQSLFQILNSQKFELRATLQKVISDTFKKYNEKDQEQVQERFIQFIDFVVNGNVAVLKDKFMDVIEPCFECMEKANDQEKKRYITGAKLILQILFKEQQSNEAFSEFEKDLQIENQQIDNSRSWKVAKIFLEVNHSNDLKVVFKKSLELIDFFDIEGLKKHVYLLSSLNLYQYLKFIPKQIADNPNQLMEQLFYPIAYLTCYLKKAFNVDEASAKGFYEFCEQQVQQQENKNSNQISDQIKKTLEDCNAMDKKALISSEQLINPENVDFYKKMLVEFGKTPQLQPAAKTITDLLNYQQLDKKVVIIIDALLLQFQKYDQKTKEELLALLKQFVDQVTNNEILKPYKDIVQAAVISLSSIKDPNNLKSAEFIEVISKFLADPKYAKLKEIIILLVQTFQTEKADNVKDLALKVVDGLLDPNVKDDAGKTAGEIRKQLGLDKVFKIADALIRFQKEIDASSEKKINERELLNLTKLILDQIFVGQNEQKDLQVFLKAIDALICLKEKKYGEINLEFFKMMNINNTNSQLIVKMLGEFQVALDHPQQLIKQKLQALANPMIQRQMQYFQSVSQKIDDNKELQYEDMYRILDKNATRAVPVMQFYEFLKRMNMDVTEHKFKEILVHIKNAPINLSTDRIDFDEFKEAMNQISGQTMLLALEYMGISKKLLIRGLIVLIIYLAIVIAFILIGVQAFAQPGAFAAVVNCIFPIIGGFSLNKSAVDKQIDAMSNSKLVQQVKKAIRVIQSSRI